jgi:hypothetical protein
MKPKQPQNGAKLDLKPTPKNKKNRTKEKHKKERCLPKIKTT